MRRCVEHRTVPTLGHLLDLKMDVIDESLKLWAPNVDVLHRVLESGDLDVVGDMINTDGLELGETLVDDGVMLDVGGLKEPSG